MKFIESNEDEYKAVKGKLSADVFLMGDGSSEVVISEDGLSEIKSDKGRCRKVGAFAGAIAKVLKKKSVNKIHLTADGGSIVDETLKATKNVAYDYSEYIFKKEADTQGTSQVNEADTQGTPSENEESCILLDTKSAEDTDFEEKNAINVRSREEGVFSAKIMPYMDGMYVYEVEVKESLRHQGYGTRHMEALLRAFSDAPVYLQVSSKNTPAVGLYKKLGFTVSTAINYYSIDK